MFQNKQKNRSKEQKKAKKNVEENENVGGDGGSKKIILFTANNFVNSVLANVIIKIKENYINA